MKSAVYLGPGKGVVIDEIPIPVPAAGQVLIRVVKCGICGTDVHMTRDHGRSFVPGRRFGHEMAGEIVEVGINAGSHHIGDLVTVLPQMGCGQCAACIAGQPVWCSGGRPAFRSAGFSQYSLSTAQSAIPLPNGLSLADAALTEPFACGHHGVMRSGLEAGARVLVIGAGGMGLSTIYWARRRGARVVAVARSDRRAEAAKAIGAEILLTSHDGVGDEIRDRLGGQPDIVFECSGAAAMLSFAIAMVRPRGKVVVLGYCTQPDSFVPADAVDKEIDLLFSVVYDRGDFERCIDALARVDFDTGLLVTDTVPLAALPATLDLLAKPNQHCKILVDLWAEADGIAGDTAC